MTEEQKKYQREYRRRWRLANPERAKEFERRSRERNRETRMAYARKYNKKYWETNKDKLSAKSREYYEAHSEEIKKNVAAYRLEHLGEIKRAKNARRERLFEWWYGEILPNIYCAHCGLKDPDCMEFHHPTLRRPYIHKAVKSMLNSVTSREAIEAEMKLCVVLCSNCHTREHAQLRRLAKQAKQK